MKISMLLRKKSVDKKPFVNDNREGGTHTGDAHQ